ncbi:hypothetical protein [Moraxella marmotae]|uniref:hypothetical protein n=1 Tax=Moraxella marmotae TaxID=3344520 RepID=UPI0035F37758
MKTLMVLISILFITGCLPRSMQPSPYAWELFYKNKKNDTSFEVIKSDMMKCGFDNTTNNTAYMTEDAYIRANQCMEKLGYKHSGPLKKGVCTHELYINQPACKVY